MEKYFDKNIKESNYERICKLHGICGIESTPLDSTRVTLFGLYCLNKQDSKASLRRLF